MKFKVAVVGIGLMGSGIVSVIQKNKDMEIVAIADIDINALHKVEYLLPKKALVTTNAFEVLKKKPDILIEATGTIYEAFSLVNKAIENGINVILLNSDVDQIFGYYLSKKAMTNGVILTSDAGDQHGVIVRIINEIRDMGFEVVMAGNNKGFLNRYANPESIKEEALKRRLSLKQCVSFTDGTKLAIEMALIANSQEFSLLKTGMIGPSIKNVEESLKVFDLERARKLGGVVDYVLGAQPGGSVFVIGYSDNPEEQFYMNYYKMGNGPYYLFMRPYHLCHFETPFTIRSIMEDRKPVLTQKRRVLEVGCRAKIDLQKGTKLDGIGGYHLYGILEEPGYLPIGLTEGAFLVKSKRKDDKISWNDVKFPKDDPRLVHWKEQINITK